MVHGEPTLETMQSYNKRATRIITDGFRQAEAQPLHVKLLQATFKDAWRLGTESKTGLDLFRELRSREWWEAVKSYPSAKRRKGITKHRRRGPTTAWEDPLVCGIGLDWRTIRASCTSATEWKKRSTEAIKIVLNRWKLPEVQKKQAAATGGREIEEPKTKVPRLQLLQKWKPEDEVWVKPNNTILFIADNQAMAEIMNGRLKYQRGDDEPRGLLQAATTNLCRIMDLGWTAKDSTYDMVQWRDRKWNTVADKLANDAMDEGRGCLWWADRWPGDDINIMVFVDGGKRGNGTSSAAFAAFAIRNGFMRLIGKGSVFTNDHDSFLAECRSMHLATSSLLQVLQTRSNNNTERSPDHYYL